MDQGIAGRVIEMEAQGVKRTDDLTLTGTIGVFDAGIGGIPITKMIMDIAPNVSIVYLGDTLRRPYGPQARESVIQYVKEAEQFMVNAGVDVWVIACNTASVVAADALQGLLPVVDMVSAAADCMTTEPAGQIGILGTTGTVTSGAYQRALPHHEVRGVATEELLRLAELGGGENSVLLSSVARESVAPLTKLNVSTVILACTDFTSILPTMQEAFGPQVKLVDPAKRSARLTVDTLKGLSGGSAKNANIRMYFTSDPPIDVQQYALERYGLDVPAPQYVTLR